MKLSKKLGWVYLLGVAVLIAAFLMFRRESFGTPYSNTVVYKVGDQVSLNGKTYRMVEAAGVAGYSPERPGDRLWQLVPASAPTGGAAPYRQTTVYKVGDQVTLNGKTYRMVEGAGVPGYSPERPGDRLWQLVPAAAPSAPSASYQDCVNAVEQTGFIPKVTWGSTPADKRDAKCDALLCPYWKSKYSDMTMVPEQYKRSVADCGIPATAPPPAVPNAAAPAVTGGPAPAPTPGPTVLQAPAGSATVMSGSPAPVPGPAAGQAPATIVIPAQTSPGTYLLRQVF